MKLGVSYTVFDGLELLEPNLLNSRKFCDFISVVYQTTSYFGEIDLSVEEKVKNLEKKGLIDEVIFYNPVFPSPVIFDYLRSSDAHTMEVEKRNLGREASERAGCSHHMSMDVDEFYFYQNMDLVKSIIEDKMYDTTVCKIKVYEKKPTIRKVKFEDFYVPLISDVRKMFVKEACYFEHTDPTRRVVDYERPNKFDESVVYMHHYTTVRKDYQSLLTKYKNSSARDVLQGSFSGLASQVLNLKEDCGDDYETCEDFFDIIGHI